MYYFDLPLPRIHLEKRDRDLSVLTSRWDEIETFWKQQTLEQSRLYNGFQLACNGIHVRKDALHVYANPIEYKLDRFASAFNCHIPGTNTIGIGVFGYDSETPRYYLTERSTNVLHYTNKIHLVGGVFDYTERAFVDFQTSIRAAVKAELDEEVELAQPFSEDRLEYLFAMYDEATTALSFRFRYNGAFQSIKNYENTSLIVVPQDELLLFIKNNKDKISLSTLRTLLWEHGIRLAEEMLQ